MLKPLLEINVDKYEKHCRLLGEDILTLGGATSGIGTKKCSWIRINKTLHLVSEFNFK